MTVLDRFLRYVKIDTQSDPQSGTFPSTEKQRDLSKLLVVELQAMGVKNAHLDEFGYVYATIPATSSKIDVPVICFCSHVDTSPDVTGLNVKPIVHENWQGEDIILPDDTRQVIRLSEHPDLAQQIGNDIVTASGTTLLGADNKAGVAEIMTATEFLLQNPDTPHGTIRILFTPDEEVGRGTEYVDMAKLAADFGYTVDGETLGTLENETFSADGAQIRIQGVSTHPGFAKGKLENALKIASEIVAALPQDSLSPETTEGKEGFVHPVSMQGGQDEATIDFIVRDFNAVGLRQKADLLRQITQEVLQHYPNSKADIQITQQYRNMKEVLDKYPAVVDNAIEAMRRVGLSAEPRSIRGGTDGSRLSFMGLPCPNIFAGEHAFHSRQEWVSVQDMEKAVEVIVEIAKVWEERS
ncbi:peptidase T [Persicitalea sp.]|uniref:peptidase T n=1 Tax=Persicitalea sp. TaxID=3100273 RepID=UPI0035947562